MFYILYLQVPASVPACDLHILEPLQQHSGGEGGLPLAAAAAALPWPGQAGRQEAGQAPGLQRRYRQVETTHITLQTLTGGK